MSHTFGFRFRPSAPVVLGLILISAVLPASRGGAQGNASGAAARLPDYRLTEAMVRKISTVMREWDPTPDLGSRLSGGDVGMSPERFKALPDSQKERIIVENRRRAEAKFKEGEKQLSTLSVGTLADRTAAAERIPALKAALGRAGLATSEFVQGFRAYQSAMLHVVTEENAPESVRPLSPGIHQDNVSLIRPMTKSEKLWTVMGLTGGR
jgi:hypothetical protein